MGDAILRDLRFAARQLARAPGFTAVAVASLGLGIGITTLVFSVANAFFLRSGLMPEPRSFVYFDGMRRCSSAEYLALRQDAAAQIELVAVQMTEAALETGGASESVQVEAVSPNYFAVVRMRPAVGRLSVADDDVDQGAVVISYGLWRRRFGGDASVIGRTVRLGGRVAEVVGVAPPGFRGIHWLRTTELWRLADPGRPGQGKEPWALVGRLRPDVALGDALAVLDRSFRRLGWRDRHGEPERVQLLPDSKLFLLRSAFTGLFTAVAGIVLLVSCANVAGFVAGRLDLRRAEIATRLALGGGRLRIVRQLLMESLLLAVVGALLGLLVTHWLAALAFAQLGPLVRLGGGEVSFDGRVLVVVLSSVGIATLGTGLLPAWRISRADLSSVLKAGGVGSLGARRPMRLRQALVVGQLVVSFAFLATATLYLRAAIGVARTDAGFDLARTLVSGIPCGRRGSEADRACQGEVLARVRSLAGVEKATLVSSLPFFDGPQQEVSASNRDPQADVVGAKTQVHWVGAGYFALAGARVVRGRFLLDQDDRLDTKAAVVSRALARRLWPGQDALGQRIRVTTDDGEPREVVGVIADLPMLSGAGPGGDGRGPSPTLYLPLAAYNGSALLLVSTTGKAAALAPTLRRALTADGRDFAGEVTPVDRALERNDETLFQRIGAKFLGVCALAASFLAVVGLYVTLARMATLRTREFGVRMALGAQPQGLAGLILREGTRLAAVALVLGLPVALGAGRLARVFSHRLPPSDLATLSLSALFVFGVAMVASYLPARRAARVEPMVALRCE